MSAADADTNLIAVVARQEAEERYKRLVADVQTLLETQELNQKRLEELRQRFDKLETDLRDFKDEYTRFTTKIGEDLTYFGNKLNEVDQKRVADTQLILTNIAQLAKPPTVPSKTEPLTSGSSAKIEGIDELPSVYVVKKNDSLGGIVALYNTALQKRGLPRITQAQVLDANPGLKPDLVRLGRKITIPLPTKESK
jgi:LysM repeat protein